MVEQELNEIHTVSHQFHYTQDQAHHQLLNEAHGLVDKEKQILLNQVSTWKYLLRPDNIIILLLTLGTLLYYILSKTLFSSTHNVRINGVLAGVLLILIALAWNTFLYKRESRSALLEIIQRLELILDKIQTHGINYKQEIKVPYTIPTVSLSRIIRSNTIIHLPFNLIVRNDLIQMSFGDVAPCKIEWISIENNVDSQVDQVAGGLQDSKEPRLLNRGQVFRPEFYSSFTHIPSTHGHFYFRALESPILFSIQSCLNNSRPETVIASKLRLMLNFFSFKLIWILFACSLLINSIRWVYHSSSAVYGIEFFINLQLLLLLTLAPLAYPTMLLLVRSFANAQVLGLFDALQASQTEFEDKEDVDEFDVAPAPTKTLVLDKRVVWRRFMDQLRGNDASFLAKTTGLVDSLANTTVICAIDREGTISMPSASVDRLFFINESEEPIILDVIEDTSTNFGVRFEDKDWEQYLSSLKPFALNQFLNTDCKSLYSKRRNETHRKCNQMLDHGIIKSCRQTCTCQISREIGFAEDSIKSFNPMTSIHTFAPMHPSLYTERRDDYHFEIPSMYSKIYNEKNSDSWQLFSEGSLELIVESTPDYWNGTGLGTLNDYVKKKMGEFYQNATLSDMQVVAYAYRPIPIESLPLLHSKSFAIYLNDLSNPNPTESHGHTTLLQTQSQTQEGQYEHKRNSLPRLGFLQDRITSQIDSTKEPIQESLFYQEVIKGQTFLGLVSFIFQPKPNMVDFIEDLGLGGVRFVYFSRAPQRESKAYAERLGLEIDWNSCIILSSDDGTAYMEDHDLKARLPHGVENIRSHIQNVDDVPLHVSLFAECSPFSIREMIQIFQENGEVVCCLGSSLNDFNVDCFAMADISIAVNPILGLKSKSIFQNYSIPSMAAGAAINTIPCALTLHSDTSLYSITQVIREARTLALNARQSFSFYLTCQIALFLLIFTSYLLLLPPILEAYQIIWTLWLLIPLLSFSFFFSPYDPDIMTHVPVKNNGKLKQVGRNVIYFLSRSIIPVIACCGLYIYVLIELNDKWADVYYIIDATSPSAWTYWTAQEQSILLFAQNSVMFHFLYYMMIISSTCLNRTESIWNANPFKNRVWICTCIFLLCLQITFCILLLLGNLKLFTLVPWWIYVISLVLVPIMILPIQEWVRWHDKNEWLRFQKRSKLEFNTKL